MKINSLFIIICCFLCSCTTYKYTKVQYDEAMRAWTVGKHINNMLSDCPFPNQSFPDGNGGSIVRCDLSTTYSTPSYSNSVNYSSYSFTPSYNGVNVNKNSTTTTYTTPSQSYNNGYFMTFRVNKEGYIFDLNYFISPKMANSTYESYNKWKGQK